MAARMPFSAMAGRIAPQLLKALEQMEYKHTTLVQEKVLSLPSFDKDCLVQARTGTGKTIAFLLPALQTLLSAKNLSPSQVSLLVLAPTRELAQQIADECDKLTSLCQPRLECHVAVGGSNKKSSLTKFMKGKPSILVATPGRLIDYLSEDATKQKFRDLRIVVLDEADRMLDQGFAPALMKILTQIPPKTAGWQGMCFSATMPPAINKVLHLVLRPDHVKITTIEEGGEPTVDAIPQSVIPVPSIDHVLPALHTLLASEQASHGSLKAVVFCSTARQAGLLYQLFAAPGNAAPAGVASFQMHSRMSQPARNKTVEDFKVATSGVMFASDVVGRGMDFPDIGLVIQIGLPMDKEQYVHRVGRTGRAGKLGRAVMVLIPEEMNFVSKNRDFPIKTAALPQSATSSEQVISSALARVPETAKNQAYVSFLGFTKTLTKVHGLSPAQVVALANRYSASLGLSTPPTLEARTVGKMGLKGVPGLNIEGKGGVPRREANGFGGNGFAGNGRGAHGGGAPRQGGGGGFGQRVGGGANQGKGFSSQANGNGRGQHQGQGGPAPRGFGGQQNGGQGGGAPGGGQQNKKRTFSKRD